MSEIITRYISRQLLVGMVLVTAALSGILWLTQSLRFIELMVNKGASVGTFISLTLLLLPNFLTVILPISLFAVVLFTYNRLTMDRELIVLRAAGVGQWALAKPAMLVAGGATLLAYVLNLWLIPESVRSFKELQWAVRNDVSAMVLQEGSFNEFSQGVTVYVRARSPEGELLGILIHDQRKPDRPVTMMAERGALIQTPSGPRVLMLEGSRQEVAQGSGRLNVLYFDSYAMDFRGNGANGERDRDARERSLGELFFVTVAEAGNEANLRRFRSEGHQRLATPLYHLAFALVALVSLLTGEFNRRGNLPQIGAAIGVVILIQATGLGAANLAAANSALWPTIYLTPLLPGLAALYYLLFPRRIRPWAVSSLAALGGRK